MCQNKNIKIVKILEIIHLVSRVTLEVVVIITSISTSRRNEQLEDEYAEIIYFLTILNSVLLGINISVGLLLLWLLWSGESHKATTSLNIWVIVLAGFTIFQIASSTLVYNTAMTALYYIPFSVYRIGAVHCVLIFLYPTKLLQRNIDSNKMLTLTRNEYVHRIYLISFN